MVGVKAFAFAGIAALVTTAANAADMPALPPLELPPIEEFAYGWYLRGDIGMSNQQLKKLDSVSFTADTEFLDKGGFDSAPIFGLGIGYQFNSWLRLDITGEYRGKAGFRALDRAPNGGSPTGFQTNEYTGSKSEWTFLFNAYADLGTWYNITPFIGFGAGASYNRIHHFRDVAVPVSGVAYGETAGKWDFAWAMHAGLAYSVSRNFTVELSYRYISLGDAMSGDTITYLGQNSVYNPMHFKGITSHDLRLGLRWLLDTQPPSQTYYPPPVMRRG
jgi:opacity protein-like surface antigen